MCNAASSPFGSQRAATKDRPAAPIFPVELVATILTPPGPACRLTSPNLCPNRHNSIVDRGWHVGYPASTDLTTGQGKTHEDKANGAKLEAQDGKGKTGRATRAQQKRAGVFLPVQIRADCIRFWRDS